jgi:hypothetical protein
LRRSASMGEGFIAERELYMARCGRGRWAMR